MTLLASAIVSKRFTTEPSRFGSWFRKGSEFEYYAIFGFFELLGLPFGRQQPMTFSTPQAKRDLPITFGLDRRIQRKDPFFHNGLLPQPP